MIPQIFPLGENWDAPKPPWFHLYPEGVPPSLHYPDLRVEKFLETAAEAFPDRLAIQFYRTNWDYKELLERVRQVAGGLQRLGIGPGDRVMFTLPNTPEFILAWFAAHFVGAEVVHSSPLNTTAELIKIAQTANPKVAFGLDVRIKPVVEMTRELEIPHLFTTSVRSHLPFHLAALSQLKTWTQGSGRVGPKTQAHTFAELYKGTPLREPLSTDHLATAVLQPTGGTTGTPKLAMLTHRNLVANVCQNCIMSGRDPGTETILAVLPFFHIYGATAVMLSSIAGAATLIVRPRFEAPAILDVVAKYEVTILPVVPFMVAEFIAEMDRRQVKLPKLQRCVSGASALSNEMLKAFHDRTQVEISEGYGLSEASPVTHVNPPGKPKVGSVGIPVIDTECRLMDVETGTREAAPGEVGEVTIRGPQIMKGYLDNPEETAIALRDGWLFTGDIGIMDEDYYFRIVDRKKDMIISGGLNIFPSEIEAVLSTADGVSQCAVVGEPDSKYGERVVAWVVPAAGKSFDPDSLRTFCKQSLAGYKVPKEFRECDELPRNFLGKIRRVELRAKAGDPDHRPEEDSARSDDPVAAS